MDSLEYKNVIPSLFRALPEAKSAYDSWEMPGEALPYIVFSFLEESLFTPLVRAGVHNQVQSRVFEFLELMASSSDTQVIELLWVGLFEAWAANGILRVAVIHMGPRTKALAIDAIRKLEK